MTSSLDELLNAEFKEAFDEFDKVLHALYPNITGQGGSSLRAASSITITRQAVLTDESSSFKLSANQTPN